MILLISNSTNERFRQNERGVAVDLSDKREISFWLQAAGSLETARMSTIKNGISFS